MRKGLMLVTICFFMVMSIPAMAQTDKTGTPAAAGHESHTSQGAPPATPSLEAVQPQVTDSDMSKHVQMMQGHSQKMQAQMAKIKAAANPKERQRLMREHMASMRDGMKMMKSMPTCKMMSGASMKGGEQGMMDMGNMMMCHQMMDKKMEMMQGMMEGLIESSQMKK